MAIAINFFQQFSGINAITFYVPIMFKTLGFNKNVLLFSIVLTGLMSGVGTFVALLTIDKVNNFFLLTILRIIMLVSQVAIAVI